MPSWKIIRVSQPGGEPAANQPWPQYPPRRQVSIERRGPYTRVILVANKGSAEDATPPVPMPHWA